MTVWIGRYLKPLKIVLSTSLLPEDQPPRGAGQHLSSEGIPKSRAEPNRVAVSEHCQAKTLSSASLKHEIF